VFFAIAPNRDVMADEHGGIFKGSRKTGTFWGNNGPGVCFLAFF
jgi:hypothetical protein